MSKIRFTPYAWAKLIYMRDKGNTEVAGYGISSLEDPLLVEDFMLVKQECTGATFDFDDDGLATYIDDMIEEGLQPSQFQRILIHTHPGNSASPSGTDETNFTEKFSDCNWAIMFILADGGATSCALKYKNPPIRVELPCLVDFDEEFLSSDHEGWDKEYERCVNEKKYRWVAPLKSGKATTALPGQVTNICSINNQLPKKVVNDDYFDGFDDFEEGEEEEEYNFEQNSFYNRTYNDDFKKLEEALDEEEELDEIAEELGMTREQLIDTFGISAEESKFIKDLKKGVL